MSWSVPLRKSVTPFALHPIPRLNSFTGSTAVGREVGLNSMKSPVIKEGRARTGGNGPLVILDDADMDVASTPPCSENLLTKARFA